MAAFVDPATGRPKCPFARPVSAVEIIAAGAWLGALVDRSVMPDGLLYRFGKAALSDRWRAARRRLRHDHGEYADHLEIASAGARARAGQNGQFGRFAARGAYAFGTRRAHLGAAAASALPLSEEIEERFARPYEQRAAECSGGSIRRFRPLGGARSQPMRFARLWAAGRRSRPEAAARSSRRRCAIQILIELALGGETWGDWGRDIAALVGPRHCPRIFVFRAGGLRARFAAGVFIAIVARRAGGPRLFTRPPSEFE